MMDALPSTRVNGPSPEVPAHLTPLWSGSFGRRGVLVSARHHTTEHETS